MEPGNALTQDARRGRCSHAVVIFVSTIRDIQSHSFVAILDARNLRVAASQVRRILLDMKQSITRVWCVSGLVATGYSVVSIIWYASISLYFMVRKGFLRLY
jgi:hypothetical protein